MSLITGRSLSLHVVSVLNYRVDCPVHAAASAVHGPRLELHYCMATPKTVKFIKLYKLSLHRLLNSLQTSKLSKL
jgi:hypothetical protein